MQVIKREQLNVIKDTFMQFTDEKTFARECSFALQAINKSPQLQKCNQQSMLSAVLNVAQVNLTLNPINPQAYLIPRYDKKTKGMVCVLEPSYQGLTKLITDTKSVVSVYAYCVCEGDDFRVELGTSTEIIHNPMYKSDKIEKVYAVGILPDGTKQIEVMTIEDCYKIREASESYKAYLKFKAQGKTIPCIWNNHENAMCRKTVIKRLCKYLPKTDQWEYVNKAIELDNTDYTLDIDSGTVQHITNLIRTAALDDERKSQIELEIYSGELTRDRADEIITELNLHQLEPIESGNNYNQSDINNKLDKVMQDERA